MFPSRRDDTTYANGNPITADSFTTTTSGLRSGLRHSNDKSHTSEQCHGAFGRRILNSDTNELRRYFLGSGVDVILLSLAATGEGLLVRSARIIRRFCS